MKIRTLKNNAKMIEPAGRDPIYREPPALARLFVYGFALVSPLLALSALLIPAAVLVRTGTDAGGIAVASCVTLVYVILLAAAVRRVRALASRFTPPLPLPGDIWNLNDALVRPAAWGVPVPYSAWEQRSYWATGVAHIGRHWYAYAAVKISDRFRDVSCVGFRVRFDS